MMSIPLARDWFLPDRDARPFGYRPRIVLNADVQTIHHSLLSVEPKLEQGCLVTGISNIDLGNVCVGAPIIVRHDSGIFFRRVFSGYVFSYERIAHQWGSGARILICDWKVVCDQYVRWTSLAGEGSNPIRYF
jgi:hypothetical protein